MPGRNERRDFEQDNLWVEDAPEAGCFYVQSHDGGRHTVDLSARGGIGECSCDDWGVVCRKNLEEHGRSVPAGPYGKRNPDRTRCRHIEAVREKFLNDLLRKMADNGSWYGGD